MQYHRYSMSEEAAGDFGSGGNPIEKDDLIYGVFAFLDVTFESVRREHSFGTPWSSEHEVQVLRSQILQAFRLGYSAGS